MDGLEIVRKIREKAHEERQAGEASEWHTLALQLCTEYERQFLELDAVNMGVERILNMFAHGGPE
jgi:hypothetical protein